MVATISIFTPVLIVAYFSYGHYFSLLCIGHSFIIFLLYRSLLITWVETSTSLSTAYDSVDWISPDNVAHLFRCVLLRATHGATRYYLHLHILLPSFTLLVTATIYIILSTLWALGNGSLMTIIYWMNM